MLQLHYFKTGKMGFVEMANRHFGIFITKNSVCRVIGDLLMTGIIESDNRYSKTGRKCRGYRIGKEWRGNVVPVAIKNPFLRKKIEQIRQNPTQTLPEPYLTIFNNMKKLTLDPSIRDYLMPPPGHGLDYWNWAIHSILNKSYFAIACKKTGRMFHNIANMPRELRPFLRLDGEPLVEVDVACCQPLLLSTLYDSSNPEDKAERECYLIEQKRDFYALFSGLGMERAKTKETVFRDVFFGPVVEDRPAWRIFKARFPILAQHIRDVKQGQHNRLAIRLQRLESEAVIGGACERLCRDGVFAVTIHDAVLCRESSADLVVAVLRSEVEAVAGAAPRITIKKD